MLCKGEAVAVVADPGISDAAARACRARCGSVAATDAMPGRARTKSGWSTACLW